MKGLSTSCCCFGEAAAGCGDDGSSLAAAAAAEEKGAHLGELAVAATSRSLTDEPRTAGKEQLEFDR